MFGYVDGRVNYDSSLLIFFNATHSSSWAECSSRCLLSRRPLLKYCAGSATSLLLKWSKTAGELPVEFDGKPFIVCGRTIRQVCKSELRHCSWQTFDTVDVCESRMIRILCILCVSLIRD